MEFIDNQNIENKEIYPLSIFFVRSNDLTIRNAKITYASSTFYVTQKLRCTHSYKPAVII